MRHEADLLQSPAAFRKWLGRHADTKRELLVGFYKADSGKFFEAQPPSYKRAATGFVLSAKKDETRVKRAQILIELSAAGQRLDQSLRRPAK